MKITDEREMQKKNKDRKEKGGTEAILLVTLLQL